MRFLLFCHLLLPVIMVGQCMDTMVLHRVDSLILLSREQTGEGAFAAALSTSARAETLAREQCGELSVAYGSATFNEGRVRYFMDENEAAIPWYRQSLAIRAQVLGKEHPDYGKSLNNLAIAYDELGRYEEAEPLYRAALAIREKSAGRESATFANALANLGSLYEQMGKYEAAEALSLEAREIRGRVLGKEHPYYSASLNNLGNLYLRLNNLEQAETYYQEAVMIMEALGDTTSVDYTLQLDNLGTLRWRQGDLVRAGNDFRRALNIVEDWIGTDNQYYFQVLFHLGQLRGHQGRPEAALDYFDRAITTLRKTGREDSEDFAAVLGEYSIIKAAMQQSDTALVVGRTAWQIARRNLAADHPELLYYQENLARLEWSFGNRKVALELYRKSAVRIEETVQNAVRHLAEAELTPYLKPFNNFFSAYASLATVEPEGAQLAYNGILLRKGFLLEHRRRMNHVLRSDLSTAEALKKLAANQDRLAQLRAREPNNSTTSDSLQAQIQAEEKRLIRHTPSLKEALTVPRWREVREALRPGEVAVEFITYRPAFKGSVVAVQYAALCLTKTVAEPFFVPLGTQEELDQLLLGGELKRAELINALYTPGPRSRALYDWLWQPLLEATANQAPDLKVSSWYLAAAGGLHQLNLGAIPTPAGGVVTDHYTVTNLGSTRALLQSSPPQGDTDSPEAIVLGGVDYGGVAEVASSSRRGAVNETESGWSFLPWTEVEAGSIAAILTEAGYRTDLRLGLEAAEESLKKRAAPQILHVATHGFYFPAVEQSVESGPTRLAFVSSEEPMMRSGLVLAGANETWTRGTPLQDKKEDGILTALEASQLDLRGTELVVLSACDTGLGQLRGDEGVYGLQRGLRAAGANRIIISLWQVPDFETQAFMLAFYKNLVTMNGDISGAFSTARQEIRAQYPEPVYWAGFLLLE